MLIPEKGQCRSVTPLHYFWTHRIPPAGFPKFDFEYNIFLSTIAAIDFCMDIVIVALPMPIIGSLQVSQRRKFMLAFIFGLGILYVQLQASMVFAKTVSCIVATIMRFYHSLRIYLIEVGRYDPRKGYGSVVCLKVFDKF